MDFSRLRSGGNISRAVRRLIAFTAIVVALSSPAQAQSGLFRTDDYLSIVRTSKITWLLNYDRLVDSLRTVSLFVTLDVLSDSLDANPRGGGGGAWQPDSVDAIFTEIGDRKLTEQNLNPGAANDMVLVTAGGAANWTATPNLPRDYAHVFWLGGGMNPQSTGDTASNKHMLYATVLHREYPVAHGTTYSGLRVNIHIRGGDGINGYVYNTYSNTMNTTGSGAAAIGQGDKLVLRFFPKTGVLVDKPIRLYRVPDGQQTIGAGGTPVYGEEIGYLNIPASEFPATGNINMEVTLSYAVK